MLWLGWLPCVPIENLHDAQQIQIQERFQLSLVGKVAYGEDWISRADIPLKPVHGLEFLKPLHHSTPCRQLLERLKVIQSNP